MTPFFTELDKGAGYSDFSYKVSDENAGNPDLKTMPAMVVLNPFGWWMINGCERKGKVAYKNIETRTWKLPRKYINRWIMILSGAKFHSAYASVEHKLHYMPKKTALGAVKFSEWRYMTDEDEAAAMCGIYENAKSFLVCERKRLIKPFEQNGGQKITNIEFKKDLLQFEKPVKVFTP